MLTALVLSSTFAATTPTEPEPLYVAWCDGSRANLVGRIDARGVQATTALPRPTLEHLATEVRGVAFHRGDRPSTLTWLQPFVAPIANEIGGTPYAAGIEPFGDDSYLKLVLGACSTRGLMVSEPASPATSLRFEGIEVDGTWIQAQASHSDYGSAVHLTVVGDERQTVTAALTHLGC